MNPSTPIYRSTQLGKRMTISFDGPRIPDDDRLGELREELLRATKDQAVVEVAFDLAGVKIVPSLMLGLMAWLSRNKVDVSVHHASDEIRDTLAFTDLDTIIDVCDTET